MCTHTHTHMNTHTHMCTCTHVHSAQAHNKWHYNFEVTLNNNSSLMRMAHLHTTSNYSSAPSSQARTGSWSVDHTGCYKSNNLHPAEWHCNTSLHHVTRNVYTLVCRYNCEYTRTHMHTKKHTHTHIHTHSQAHTCQQTYTYTHTCIHITHRHHIHITHTHILYTNPNWGMWPCVLTFKQRSHVEFAEHFAITMIRNDIRHTWLKWKTDEYN